MKKGMRMDTKFKSEMYIFLSFVIFITYLYLIK